MTVCGRIRLRVLACVTLALGVTPLAPLCEAKAGESHALAMHGAPALPPSFTHMPYARPDAPKGGRLVWGILGTFDSLNPLIVRGIAVQQIRGFVLESLMTRGNDEAFTLYGLLARSVETDDARSYITFHLDPRARFADGKPVTAEDVLFSWELLRDKGRPNHRQYYSKVAKAEAPDPLTVRFDFGGAGDRELPLILGLMPVLPRHAVDPATFEETTMTGPIGSGPYRVTAVKPGASVTLTRNPDYWGRDLPVNRGLWNFDEIRLDFYRESNGQFEAFKRGLYDFRVEREPLRWHSGYDFPAARSGEVIRDTIKTGMPQPSEFLVFNTRRPIFSDIRVRQALTLLFDFEWINRNYFFGLYVRSAGFFAGSELSAYGRPADERERELLKPFTARIPADILDGNYRLPVTDGGPDDAVTASGRASPGACYRSRRMARVWAGHLGAPPTRVMAGRGQSRCLLPLLSTTFHRLAALVPPLPANRTSSPAEESAPEASPGVKVSVGPAQLSRALVVQAVAAPVVGVFAAPKTPRARLSEPNEVEM